MDNDKLYIYQILFNGLDTYEAARRRLNFPPEKLDASDLSSADEVSKLRKRPAAVDDDSDSELEQSTVIQETPKTTKKGRKHCSRVLHLPPPPTPVPTQMASQLNALPVPSLVLASSFNTVKQSILSVVLLITIK